MEFCIDRDSAVSVRQQIKGTIEYGISFGVFGVGSQLPSVRELAEQTGVATMTISHVYRELKADGLIETRNGAGTFVADSSQARMASGGDIEELHRDMDALIDRAQNIGIRVSDLTALLRARISYRLDIGRRASVMMVGLFPEATASYATAIADQLGNTAIVESVTIDEIKADAALRDRVNCSDLVVCFATKHGELTSLLPNAKVASIGFIPSEETRMALASLDPMSAVVAVSLFSAFMPILKSGVERFAAHVQNIETVNIDDDTLPKLLKRCNVLVYATGSEDIIERSGPWLHAIEYRHTPDPGDIRRLVMPFLAGSAKNSY